VTVRIDDEGNETDALFELADLDGREVLEIGCGDGRLTWRYADRAARVTAIEPFADGLARAEQSRPEHLRSKVELRRAALLDFAATSEADVVDVSILSWSLC
jgi:cyclopropane fatty-acyl-phospholipid synthase-like methyltransferase